MLLFAALLPGLRARQVAYGLNDSTLSRVILSSSFGRGVVRGFRSREGRHCVLICLELYMFCKSAGKVCLESVSHKAFMSRLRSLRHCQ